MKHIVITLLILIAAPLAQAQKATVLKVKNQQAIVQFPPGSPPYAGQTLDISSGGGGDKKRSVGPRDNIIGVSGLLSSISNSLNSQDILTFNISGYYGWNTGQYEYGPVASFGYTNVDPRSDRTIRAGGFLDYNLVHNAPGVDWVYGVGTLATLGQKSVSITGGHEASETLMGLFVGGFAKWFPLGNSVALRGDLGYDFERVAPSGASYNRSGFLARGGLWVYF